jgi:hypothetical protein
MTTLIFIDAFNGTRLRVGYLAVPSTGLSVKRAWRQSPPAQLGDFMINNSTGVSEVECRHR